jgi:hypothetical protein
MKNWEYKIIDSKDLQRGLSLKFPSREELEEYLCVLGSEGWEVINLDFNEIDNRFSFVGVLKRELA